MSGKIFGEEGEYSGKCARGFVRGKRAVFFVGLIFHGEMSGDVWEELFGAGAPCRITHICV